MAKIRDTLNPAMNVSIRSIFRVSAIPTLTLILASVGYYIMNRRNLSSLLVLLLLALSFSTTVSAQSRNKSRQRKAAMFDEYGTLSYCSVTARLDNFAIQLESDRSQQ